MRARSLPERTRIPYDTPEIALADRETSAEFLPADCPRQVGAPADAASDEHRFANICVALLVLVARWSREETSASIDVSARAITWLRGDTGAADAPATCRRFRIRVPIAAQDSLTSLAAQLRDALDAPGTIVDDAQRSHVLVDVATNPNPALPADLSLVLTPGDGAATAVVFGDPTRYHASTIARVAAALTQLHAAAVANAGEPMLRMELVHPADRTLMIATWNNTREPRVGIQLMHRLIEARADLSPHAVAASDGASRLTYRALNAQANQLAMQLVAEGIGVGTIVGLVAPRCLELLVALLAIQKAGAAFLPIDPMLPRDRIRFMLEDSRCALVLVHPSLQARLDDVADGLPTKLTWLDRMNHDAPLDARAQLPDRCTPDAPVYLLYTSGSTGRPKGVLVPHRALCNHALWFARRIGLTASDRMLQHASIGFDAAMPELFAPLVCGATVVMAPPEANRDLRALPEVIQRERISVVQMVPSALRALVVESSLARCTTLRYLVSGGEALDGALAAAVRRSLPAIRLGNFYGPTETTVDATSFEVPRDVDATSIIPIGGPVANAVVRVLDPRLRLTPIGAPGELCIGGLGLALGYLNVPDRDVASFVPDPFAPGERLYRTGDLVRWREDGNLEYFGRIDTQVKLRGYRIEPGEIEALLHANPAIAQAAVTLREDVPGDPQLVAYVVHRLGMSVTVAELRETLARVLPAYMVPSAFNFLDTLPLTENGKLDRRALPPPVAHTTAPHDPLNDPLEVSLQRIWEEALGVSPIGLDSDFFALGGHSLKAIRLLSEIERVHGVVLRAPTLFESPTIRTLADRMREQTPREVSTIVPVQPHGSRPPIFFAPGGGGELFVFDGLARALGADQPFYALDMYVFDEIELPEHPVTLHAIAARMLQDLRAIQPHGPYQLAGYSLGGNLVLEIAQQLRAAGETVALLALLDCDGPGYPHVQPFLTRTINHFEQALAMRGGSARYLGERVRRTVRAIVHPTPDPVKLYADQDGVQHVPSQVLEALEHALTPVLRAWEDYSARFYGGPVVLIRASVRFNNIGIVDDDPYLGWGQLVGGTLRLEEMPCNHFEMVRPEFATRLAAILSRHLACFIRPAGATPV